MFSDISPAPWTSGSHCLDPRRFQAAFIVRSRLVVTVMDMMLFPRIGGSATLSVTGIAREVER
jgi:hypothetical protein